LVVFAVGEPVYTTDTHQLYLGDGITPGGRQVSGSGGTNLILDTYANIHAQILPAGTIAFATDQSKLFIGNGTTPGGIEVGNDDDYIRTGFSNRYGADVSFNTVKDALDYIFQFAAPIPDSYYYGEVPANGPISDGAAFLAALTRMNYASGDLSILHTSDNTYRVFAFAKSHGAITDIQDPGFMNASILAAYETPPREITVSGRAYYVYISVDPYFSPTGQAVLYKTP